MTVVTFTIENFYDLIVSFDGDLMEEHIRKLVDGDINFNIVGSSITVSEENQQKVESYCRQLTFLQELRG